MATLKLAFKVNAPGFVSRAIRFITKSQDGLSHVEMVFPDGRSYSSREPWGTGWKQIDYDKEPAGHWTFVDLLDIDEAAIARMIQWCDENAGQPYDFLGIALFYLGIKNSDPWLFCSEVVLKLCQGAGRFHHLDPSLTSPQRMYDAAIVDYEARRPRFA